ncbi:MAG: hypothetical protein LBE62_11220 [Azonexus sp.]|jgi:hypothetical protein|nr:hypothetical protein [Azonexus sp.]
MTNDEDTIQCTEHGEATATFICEHLVANPQQRWYCDYPSEDNPWPDAWCGECDAEFEKEGEWNEKNECAANIKIVCNYCYESGHASSIEAVEKKVADSWKQMLTECHQQLSAKQELLKNQFSLSRHKRWDYDQETGLLTFSNDGIPAVIANIEMIGSISSITDTWLWSWANFHFLPNVRTRIVAVRDLGEASDFPRLTVPKWYADTVDGWEMSAIATHVLDAQGVYRAPTDNGFLFMAMSDLRFAT